MIGDATMFHLPQSRTNRASVRPKVEAESERMVRLWGADASEMARILAFRAEAGLLHESETGFWKGVVKAIGHRIGLPDEAPRGNALLIN